MDDNKLVSSTSVVSSCHLYSTDSGAVTVTGRQLDPQTELFETKTELRHAGGLVIWYFAPFDYDAYVENKRLRTYGV